jgi:hypothetical protein
MVQLITINPFPVHAIGAVDWQQEVFIADGGRRFLQNVVELLHMAASLKKRRECST